MRTEESYLRWQMVMEAAALGISWILILTFVFDITDIKQLVVLEGILSTATIIWWMKWEKARLPKSA